MKKILILLLLLLLVGCKSVKSQDFEILGPNSGEVGSKVKLEIDIDVEVYWHSSNPEIATIANNGEVTPLKVGHTFITATLADDESIQRMIVFTVTEGTNDIEDPSDPDIEEPSNPDIEEPSDPDIEDSNYVIYHTRILSIDTAKQEMELLNVPNKKYASNLSVSQLLDSQIKPLTFDSLTIGMENIYVAINKETGLIDKILVDGVIGFRNIRVAIRNKIDNIAIDDDIYHNNITLIPNSAVIIRTYDGGTSITTGSHQQINISITNGKINIGSGNQSLISDKRIIIENLGSIQVTSISRGTSSKPAYAGNLEVAIVGAKLLLVNDVSLESYLTKVVPSEMPSSFHAEALKAQAVAARTYAYADIFNKTNIKYGYTVDDSVKSQVYNNQDVNTKTTNAVNQTKGFIMTYNNEPINAFYYSTSAGITANANEVWINNRNLGDVIPYLIGKNLSKVNGEVKTFNYQDEANMLEFFKTIKIDTPDNNSLFHRWVTIMNAAQIKNTLDTNLKITFAANPNLVLTKVGDSWVSQTIPNDIGEVIDVYVARRGVSGVVIELDIITTTGTYKVINQYSIRFTIRPMHAGTTVQTKRAKNTDNNYTSTVNNISILYSGFFAIEKMGNTYYFYGGGNGHGVGMSQYGASGLGNQGKLYQEILQTYYNDVALTDISYSYQFNEAALAALKVLA